MPSVTHTCADYQINALSEDRLAQSASQNRRLAIVGLGLLILFIRTPTTFVTPQLWAEDGKLYAAAYNTGWHSLLQPLNGTLNLYGAAVATIAVNFPPILAPWIEVYAAHAATLLIVFMIMSPRFEMPYREIAALAVVCAPAGFEVLGFLVNAQWVLPLGLFVLLFSRPSDSTLIWLIEALFVAFVGLEGPLGTCLLPLYLWRLCSVKGSARLRICILAATLAVTACVQIAFLRNDLGVFNVVEPHPYRPSLWLTMPVRWLDAIGPLNSGIIGFRRGAIGVVVLGALALIKFSWRAPYRELKLAMLFFATVILYAGMFKYRANLDTIVEECGRYFFAGSVFFYWFLCIAAATSRTMPHTITAVALVTLINGALVGVSIRPAPALPWSHFVSQIGKGPISIPISPAGWSIHLLH